MVTWAMTQETVTSWTLRLHKAQTVRSVHCYDYHSRLLDEAHPRVVGEGGQRLSEGRHLAAQRGQGLCGERSLERLLVPLQGHKLNRTHKRRTDKNVRGCNCTIQLSSSPIGHVPIRTSAPMKICHVQTRW